MGKESLWLWLCIGDFNEVGSIWEKQGGVECSSSRVENFQKIMSDCALMDPEFKGNAFTWTNNQMGNNCIRERIDRAMVSVDWRHKFPLAQVFHEVDLGSDHCPLILNCSVPLQKVPKLKFESMWSTHPGCEDIIVKAWGRPVFGSALFQLLQRLKNCRKDLIYWSKEVFSNNKVQLDTLKEELAIIQAKEPLEVFTNRQQQLKHEIKILLRREEMFFHQCSSGFATETGIRPSSMLQLSNAVNATKFSELKMMMAIGSPQIEKSTPTSEATSTSSSKALALQSG